MLYYHVFTEPSLTLDMDVIKENTMIGPINGTVFGNASLIPGKFGNALSTDNKSSQFIKYKKALSECFSNPEVCGADGLTYSLWVQMLDPQQNASDKHTVLDSGGCYVQLTGLCLRQIGWDARLEVFITTSTYMYSFISPPGTWELGRWLHIVFTWSHNSTIAVFVNGCIVRGTAFSGPYSPAFGNYPFVLGASTLRQYFAHLNLDHILIWYDTLTSYEVWQLYVQGGTI